MASVSPQPRVGTIFPPVLSPNDGVRQLRWQGLLRERFKLCSRSSGYSLRGSQTRVSRRSVCAVTGMAYFTIVNSEMCLVGSWLGQVAARDAHERLLAVLAACLLFTHARASFGYSVLNWLQCQILHTSLRMFFINWQGSPEALFRNYQIFRWVF